MKLLKLWWTPELKILTCFTHFYFQLQKAKDDAEEAYNSISEAAKKEVNKMI